MDTPTHTPTPETLAWAILEGAEATDGVKSMAEDRAACGGLHAPSTVSDYLFWLEDEAEIQEANFESLPDMYREVPPYIAVLRDFAARLRDLGFSYESTPFEEADEADLAEKAELMEDGDPDEEEEVELMVAAYEWICPKCGEYQRIIEVPLTVTCVNCGKTFPVADHHYAYA